MSFFLKKRPPPFAPLCYVIVEGKYLATFKANQEDYAYTTTSDFNKSPVVTVAYGTAIEAFFKALDIPVHLYQGASPSGSSST